MGTTPNRIKAESQRENNSSILKRFLNIRKCDNLIKTHINFENSFHGIKSNIEKKLHDTNIGNTKVKYVAKNHNFRKEIGIATNNDDMKSKTVYFNLSIHFSKKQMHKLKYSPKKILKMDQNSLYKINASLFNAVSFIA